MTTHAPQTITLNGKPHQTASQTVAQLLEELEIAPTGIAVAQNSQVVRRAQHAQTPIHAGDNIEIIRAVQGG